MTVSKRNRHIRRFLRLLAGISLVIELVFSIALPKIKGEPVYLDVNDGYIIAGSITLLLAIEAVRKLASKGAEALGDKISKNNN